MIFLTGQDVLKSWTRPDCRSDKINDKSLDKKKKKSLRAFLPSSGGPLPGALTKMLLLSNETGFLKTHKYVKIYVL